MQMREKRVPPPFASPFSAAKGDVLVNVALRIHDHGRPRLLVTNQVRSMGETRQIKLFENHRTPTFPFPTLNLLTMTGDRDTA